MAIIESDAHYRDTLRRIAALDALIGRLRAIQAEAIANLKYTLGHLKNDAADWEALDAYGARPTAGAAE